MDSRKRFFRIPERSRRLQRLLIQAPDPHSPDGRELTDLILQRLAELNSVFDITPVICVPKVEENLADLVKVLRAAEKGIAQSLFTLRGFHQCDQT